MIVLVLTDLTLIAANISRIQLIKAPALKMKFSILKDLTDLSPYFPFNLYFPGIFPPPGLLS